MLIDNLGILIEDVLDGTDSGEILRIAKTDRGGLPIVMVVDSDLGAGCEVDVTIIASDNPDMSDFEVVGVFPTVDADTGRNVFVRRIHTQAQYIQAIVTFSGYESGEVGLLVFAGTGLMNVG